MTALSPFFVLAAGGPPAFFAELALLLVLAAVIAYVCHRLRVLSIVSFLVTGALIGPHALGLIENQELIEAGAEVGVILLLFTIGIEFSLEKLGRIQRLIFVGGGLQVGLVLLVVGGALLAFGVSWQAALYTGCLVALSSTAIVMKLLMSGGETNSEGGQAALGILIFQDLAVVAMVLLVPMLGDGGGSSAGIALALAKAAAIIALVLLVARRLMPPLLEAVARTCSQEIFLLTVVAVCFGTAYLTSLAGVSLSLGAFLAGLLVSESRFSELAFGEILPLQILFSAAFFISVGLLLDLGFVFDHPLLILGIVLAAVLVKTATTALSLRLLGYGGGTVAFASLMLAQVGEFSFVLERTGRAAGLSPAGLEEGGSETFIAATVLLMVATPVLARLGERARRRREPVSTLGAELPIEDERTAVELADHVVVAGYGDAARALVPALERRGLPHVVLTLSPDGARHAEGVSPNVLRGNYTRRHELMLARTDAARLLVVADDDLETTRRVVSAARLLGAGLRIVARVRFASEVAQIEEAGADVVVAEEVEAVLRVVDEVVGAPPSRAASEGETLRRDLTAAADDARGAAIALSAAQVADPRCAHAAETRAVRPHTAGCEECLRSGDRWVHLRLCMSCGHVGCCDSSKNRHASAHARATGHPVIRSLEPGEEWAWCYEDEVTL